MKVIFKFPWQGRNVGEVENFDDVTARRLQSLSLVSTNIPETVPWNGERDKMVRPKRGRPRKKPELAQTKLVTA